ncbi:MAG: hypothetical protein ACREEM_32290 [Blastocatellia bacterium]
MVKTAINPPQAKRLAEARLRVASWFMAAPRRKETQFFVHQPLLPFARTTSRFNTSSVETLCSSVNL